MSAAGWIMAYWVLGLWLNAKALPEVLGKRRGLYPASEGERVAMVALIMLCSWLWPLGRISIGPPK